MNLIKIHIDIIKRQEIKQKVALNQYKYFYRNKVTVPVCLILFPYISLTIINQE